MPINEMLIIECWLHLVLDAQEVCHADLRLQLGSDANHLVGPV